MTLLLNKKDVFNYWLEKSPDLLLAMSVLEKRENWITTSEADIERVSSLIPLLTIDELFTNEQILISISTGLFYSQSMRLLNYLESLSPGYLTNLLMQAKESQDDVSSQLFLSRLQLLKDYKSFDEVFPSISSKWVKNLLDESPDFVGETHLLTLVSRYQELIPSNTKDLKEELDLLSYYLKDRIKSSTENKTEANFSNLFSKLNTIDDDDDDDDDFDEEDEYEDILPEKSSFKKTSPLTKSEVDFITKGFEKTFSDNYELNLSTDYKDFLEIKEELTSIASVEVYPVSKKEVNEQAMMFFDLPLNIISSCSDVASLTPLELRRRFMSAIDEEIKEIKNQIHILELNFNKTVNYLITYNNVINHLSLEGLEAIINAYKQTSAKEIKEEQALDLKRILNSDELKTALDTLKNNEKNSDVASISLDEKHIVKELYSSKEINEFKAEHQDSKSDLIERFIEKKITLPSIRYKKLAKSDNLFSSIDNLYQNFPHFSEVIEYLDDYCHLQKSGDGVFYVPPTLLVGGAGVGKTFFAHDLAKLINTHFELISMESMTAAWIMVGSSSSWNSAQPGKVFNALAYKENLNPIFVLDEIDKCMTGNYPPENTLLPLLEQFTAKNFKDECIPLKIDASHIVWFATANDEKSINTPLKSRFNMFKIPEPNAQQKKALIANIYSKILSDNSWGHNFNTTLHDSSIEYLSSQMTSGVRDLRKMITSACAKAIRDNRKDIHTQDFKTIKNNRSIGF